MLEIIFTGSVGVQRRVIFHFWPKVRKLGRFEIRWFSATKALYVLEIFIESRGEVGVLLMQDYRYHQKDVTTIIWLHLFTYIDTVILQ